MQKNVLIITCSSCGIRSRVKAYMSDKDPVCKMCSFKIIEPGKREIHSAFAESLNKLYSFAGKENP